MEQSYEEKLYFSTTDLSGHTWKSDNWLERKSVIDERRCEPCEEEDGKIISVLEKEFYSIQSHLRCRCYLTPLIAIEVGYATKDGNNGADYYLYFQRKLPDYYITKDQAEKLGWKRKKGNLSDVAPGKMIGGVPYKNKNGKLPMSNGRTWYEADINYIPGFRSTDRILFSNDGLIFVTYDHYETFFEITTR